MRNVHFLPWVGKNYNTGGIFGKKILVLGESHYCSDSEAVPDLTKLVVEKHLSGSSISTFTKFERALVGHVTEKAESKQIWDSIVFYNYLQVNMLDSRIAGSRQQYKDAEETYWQVLEKYRPEYLIVWGNRLWNNIPANNFKPINSVVLDNYEAGDGIYSLKDGTEIKVIAIYHPSSGFDWNWWYQYLKIWGI